MSNIAINDLTTGQDLDRSAMMSLVGGNDWHFLGSTYKWGNWDKVNESKCFEGFAWHDGYLKRKYKVRKTYRQVNYRTDYYNLYKGGC